MASQQNYLTTDTSYRSFLSINLLYLNQRLFKTCSVGSTDILTQTNTHQPSADGSVAIGIEGYPLIAAICRRCAEIRRFGITTPAATLLVTVGVAGNKKTGVERKITYEQLVGVATIHSSNTFPQSIGTCALSIVSSSCYGLIDFACEVGLVSSLVINEDDFCELTKIKTNNVQGFVIIIIIIIIIIYFYFIFFIKIKLYS